MSTRDFLLPDLGEGLTEAEIVRWLVAVGDVVAVDQPVVEVETAKSLVEVPAPFAGRIVTLHGAPGETVAVGTPLITVAALADDSEAADVAAEVYREEEKAGSGNVLIGYGTSEASGGGRRRRPRHRRCRSRSRSPPSRRRPGRASRWWSRRWYAGWPATSRSTCTPSTARVAGERSPAVTWSGTWPVVRTGTPFRARPVAPAPVAPAPAASGERRTPLNGFRKTVAAALSRSRSEIPEATVWVDVDATALWDLRESSRTATDAGPGLLAYIARFVVAGLQQYPVLNSRLDTERQEIVELDAINLGLAVQSERGLVVPAVLGAQTMNTARLDAEIRRVTAAAREGRATAEELSAGTFTLNNYGSFNVDGSAAIINHPQVAILGFGRILDRPWVVDGEIVVRKITQMSFVFDHRVCDGGTAAGFMRSVADAIENPASAIARL